MTTRLAALLAALLLASACSQSSSQSAASSQSGEASQTTGALDGVKYRIPLYSSGVTSAATLVRPGVYQFQTSESVSTVLAWYKSHVPGNLGGVWEGSGDESSPVANQDWGYDHAHPTGGEFSVGIQHARSDQPGYAPNTKTIVEVTDR